MYKETESKVAYWLRERQHRHFAASRNNKVPATPMATPVTRLTSSNSASETKHNNAGRTSMILQP